MHIVGNDVWYRRKWNIPDAQDWCEVSSLGPWICFLQNVWIEAGPQEHQKGIGLHVNCFCAHEVRKETSICQSNAGMFLSETLVLR